MLELTTGYIVSRCIHAVAELSVADRIGAGSKDVEDLARDCGVQPGPLRRVLRLLASRGVFREESPGFFAHTPLSETLQTGHPTSMRGWAQMTGGPIFASFSALMLSLKTGAPAFPSVHGTSPYHYFAAHQEDRAAFAEAMGDWNRQLAQSVLSARDFAGSQLIVDVGGSFGYLLADILAENPTTRGLILDLPEIAASARERLARLGLEERCQAIGGNFFESVPSGGDIYLMSWILHNWNDEDCVKILRNCRRAIAPSGRLVTIDHVIQPGNEYDFGRTSDLAMLVAFGGQERSEEEFRDLLARGGFRLMAVTPLTVPVSLLESVPA